MPLFGSRARRSACRLAFAPPFAKENHKELSCHSAVTTPTFVLDAHQLRHCQALQKVPYFDIAVLVEKKKENTTKASNNSVKMSTPPLPDILAQSAAAAAIADARIPPGDDYEEIREQVCCA